VLLEVKVIRVLLLLYKYTVPLSVDNFAWWACYTGRYTSAAVGISEFQSRVGVLGRLSLSWFGRVAVEVDSRTNMISWTIFGILTKVLALKIEQKC